MNAINTLRKKIFPHLPFFIAILLLNFLIFYFYFSKGSIVLGGEGNYWLDFTIYFKNFGYSWLNSMNGQIATTMSSIFSFPFILSFIKNEAVQSFLIVSFTYTMPFVVMYLLLVSLDPTRRWLALLVAIFFVVNPFSVTFLNGLNAWATHTLFIYPLYFLLIFKTYEDDLKLFFFFGLVSLVFAYTFTNPPHMVLIVLSIPFSLILVSRIKKKSIDWRLIIKKTLIVYCSLFLFHIWWITQWAFALRAAIQSFPVNVAKSWLVTDSAGSLVFFTQIFSFLWLIPNPPNYNFLSFYYHLPYVYIFLFIPFFIIFYWLISKKYKNHVNKVIYFLLFVLILLIMLLKGVTPPFKNILIYCFDYLPFCSVFKTAPEKFGVFFVFLFSLLLFYILKTLKNSPIFFAFMLYVAIVSVPFFTGNFIPDNKIADNKYSTPKFIEKPAFRQFWHDMKLKYLDARILSLPSYLNYAVMIHLHGQKYFLGIDPILMNIPQPFIADYSSNNYIDLFLKLDSPYHQKMLGSASIRYIVLDKDQTSWIGKLTDQSLSEVENILNHKYPLLADYGDIRVYANPDFLPHLYIPSVLIRSSLAIEKLSQITNSSSFDLKSAIFNKSENIPLLFANKKSNQIDIGNTPQVEFKKINSTKYRVIIHNAKTPFPLVFSELYHDQWMLYLKKINHPQVTLDSVPKTYQILPSNIEDQPTKEEVNQFIKQGFLSRTGSQFISKNFNGTIQNNNLGNGEVYETWLFNEALMVPKNMHFLVNDNANSWIIDPQKLCSNSNFCLPEPNGTYTLEFVIEFWPQRFFYITVGITVFVLITTAFLFIFLRGFQKKQK